MTNTTIVSIFYIKRHFVLISSSKGSQNSDSRRRSNVHTALKKNLLFLMIPWSDGNRHLNLLSKSSVDEGKSLSSVNKKRTVL